MIRDPDDGGRAHTRHQQMSNVAVRTYQQREVSSEHNKETVSRKKKDKKTKTKSKKRNTKQK